jgi:hypothetical protein
MLLKSFGRWRRISHHDNYFARSERSGSCQGLVITHKSQSRKRRKHVAAGFSRHQPAGTRATAHRSREALASSVVICYRRFAIGVTSPIGLTRLLPELYSTGRGCTDRAHAEGGSGPKKVVPGASYRICFGTAPNSLTRWRVVLVDSQPHAVRADLAGRWKSCDGFRPS